MKNKIFGLAMEKWINLFIAKRRIIIPIVLLLLIILTPSYYFYSKYKKTENLLKSAASGGIPDSNTEALIDRVGKLIELPTVEIPTVATVSDKTKLQNQAFFARAENGDKVLIYAKTQKAILYREKTNKIIDVGYINIAEPAKSQDAQITERSPAKIVLYNGTKTTDLIYTVEQHLIAKIAYIELVDKDNAKRDDYEKTMVIDISNKHQDIAENLAKELNGSISQLPEGELKPENADILVILGKAR